MNKQTMVKHINKLLEQKGYDPQLFDVEALVDSSLSLEENIKLIEQQYGIKLRNDIFTKEDYEILEQLAQKYFDGQITQYVEENNIEEKLKKFENISDPLEHFSKVLFPEIVGDYDRIRKAILTMLVSKYDHPNARLRLHILLYGPPGTAKTTILLWLKHYLNCYFISSCASAVGLKGDASNGELTPGVLAMNDLRVLLIDELDKFKKDDTLALLESMEEGFYTITKGKFRESFHARVRIVATANDISKFSDALLDRFDFKFEIKYPSPNERKIIADNIVDTFLNDQSTQTNITELKEYIRICQKHRPDIKDRNKIKEVIREYIDLTNCEKSVRDLELSILRIAYNIARLRLDDMNAVDVVEAIRLKDNNLSESKYKYLKAIALGVV